jgi:hydrogenase expression/formation protein HypE
MIEKMVCTPPKLHYDTIQLSHGAGGKLSQALIEHVFLPEFSNKKLEKMEDQAVFSVEKGKMAFSTDTFVVNPIFFPGGNIGELAINGTVNDVAMSGAKPLYLSVGFILEEGFSVSDLQKIVKSMKIAAEKAGVKIITGDTKVVNKGACDKIFINTSGVGVISENIDLGIHQIKEGDKIIVTGTLADHGMAVMTKREELSFQSEIQSDTAALNHIIEKLLKEKIQVKALRDPTRGGVATTLNEWAQQSDLGIKIYEEKIPVHNNVRGACEILGIDPLFVANEGKMLIAVAPEDEKRALEILKTLEFAEKSVTIGEVKDSHKGMLVMETALGIERLVEMPVGEQLPRIC